MQDRWTASGRGGCRGVVVVVGGGGGFGGVVDDALRLRMGCK